MDVTYSKVITATQSTTLTIGTWSGVGVAKSGGAKGSSVAGLLVVFGNDGVDTLIQLINRGGLQLLINFLKTFVLHSFLYVHHILA